MLKGSVTSTKTGEAYFLLLKVFLICFICKTRINADDDVGIFQGEVLIALGRDSQKGLRENAARLVGNNILAHQQAFLVLIRHC